MSNKRIFISFDYDNDRNYRYLLKALANNPRSDISFEDLTPEEIQSYNISRIKAALTNRISKSTHTLVIIGKHANSYHPDSKKIGQRNWQWWEIEKSYEEGKKFIAVRIDSSNSTPTPLYGKGASWARSFNVDSIIKAIDEA
ncbi:MAG: TIR domain-containing protein [Atribacterota bacterium]|nr:TIR domain-containing protein [Atribacterota bacterium]